MSLRAATLPVDAVIFDLEDAVPLPEKETARIMVRDSVRLLKARGISTFVRVNSISTGLTQKDIEATAIKGLNGFVLAKSETLEDVSRIDRLLSRTERLSGLEKGSLKVIALIESARGLMNSLQIASCNQRMVALAFGAGDYLRDLGRDVVKISKEETELLYARSHIVNVCRAAGIQSVDTPFLGMLTDRDGFSREVQLAAQLGFNGKQCIHPSQIEFINVVFSPSSEDIDRGKRVVQAFSEAQAHGLGATSLDGRMIDYMSYQHAKEVLENWQAIEEREKAKKGNSAASMFEIFGRQTRPKDHRSKAHSKGSRREPR
jgi:citrate lyase subunit beta/citryl-CoA lyase